MKRWFDRFLRCNVVSINRVNSMPRKKKRSITDELLGGSLFNDTELTSDKLSETGYSISVVQTPEGAKIKAKVGEDTDVNAFRKQLQQKYARMPLGGPRPPSSKEECSLCGRVMLYYSLLGVVSVVKDCSAKVA